MIIIVTGPLLLVIFVSSIAVLLFLIIILRWSAFQALLFTAILTGLFAGIPLIEIPEVVTSGFGDTLADIGIVIGMGVILGKLLSLSGATTTIATSILKVFGKEKSLLAITAVGWVVSIPVFFDAAFVVFVPLIRNLSKMTGIAFASFVAALAMGLAVTHATVMPTPGPLLVAANLDLNLGVFFIYAVIVSIPAAIVGGVLYGGYLNKKYTSGPCGPVTEQTTEEAEALSGAKKLPGVFLSYSLLILPIVLILANTVTGFALPEGNMLRTLFGLIGEKSIAMLLAVMVCAWALRTYIKKDMHEAYLDAIKDGGLIILITGAGGAFGYMIKSTGIGDYLVTTIQHWSIPVILLGYLLALLIRIAQGSTTVALVTASAVLGPVMADLDISAIIVALGICAGGLGVSLPNDSGFWVVQRFSGFEMKDTFRVWTFGTLITGLVMLSMVLLLNLFSGILPGL